MYRSFVPHMYIYKEIKMCDTHVFIYILYMLPTYDDNLEQFNICT